MKPTFVRVWHRAQTRNPSDDMAIAANMRPNHGSFAGVRVLEDVKSIGPTWQADCVGYLNVTFKGESDAWLMVLRDDLVHLRPDLEATFPEDV
ncbi:hypothetical protein PH7735_00804 [Shimia thalassica]|uniref:Uncharacterized protein n=1 Tax=Shimia thalassica TaxID=1715693 RepID=A0A0P1I334_9RHOB|nr:hypothetical protein [Shimia thalassica]CUJ87698.1 hypothetical protein PH7735_00804 [Shimia thalassica]